MNEARITRKLREIGGIINSTDLNYNFRVMQEDLQGAIQGLIFTERSQAEYMADRDLIPENELVPGYWVAVSETGKVYQYNVNSDVYKTGINRWFGPSDGDLPVIPYIDNGVPSSGQWLNGWYKMRSNAANSYEYTSTTMGNTVFNHGDWAVWSQVNGVFKWVRVPKWIEIMDVTSILEQGIVGKLSDLHTKDKTSIVNAINEVRDEMGWIEELTTFNKVTLVAAINELDGDIGDVNDLHTQHKATLVGAINEVNDNMGDLDDLTTAQKGTLVQAINELDGEMGDLSNLHTEHKDTIVGAVNEVHDDLGTLSNLHTTAKSNAVAAINEVQDELGDIATLTTTVKTDAVGAINNLDNDLGKIVNLTTAARGNTVAAINELKSEVDALQGAMIFIGRIDENTATLEGPGGQDLLTDRALEIMDVEEVKTGWTLVDNEQNSWYFRGDEWINLEQPNIYPAQDNILGMLKGSSDVTFPSPGIPEILNTRNSDKLGNQLPAYYGTQAEMDLKAFKTNVLELDNTTPYEPSAEYHPATKGYVDFMSTASIWGDIIGSIVDQEDLVDWMDEKADKINVLELDNTTSYVPSLPFHPSTKDYVDTRFNEVNNWGQIEGDITDQLDLQNTLLDKQDVSTAWNNENLILSTVEPEVPLQGFLVWIDVNS